MKLHKYPIKSQIGIFNHEKEIEEYVMKKNSSAGLFFSYMLINEDSFIYTNDVNEYLMRYNMLKNYKFYSYSQNLDELPAKWIDVITLIDEELMKTQKEKERLDKQNA